MWNMTVLDVELKQHLHYSNRHNLMINKKPTNSQKGKSKKNLEIN